MIKEITLKEIEEKLLMFELLLEDYGTMYHEGGINDKWVQYECDGMYMTSTYDEVMESETLAELIGKAEWTSCCGDVLDHDVPMCPTCKEWC